jgi:hypothetical protein
VIADCGHLLIGERPGVCAEAIENFLRFNPSERADPSRTSG